MEKRVFTTPDSLQAIRPFWEHWQNQPNNDYEQFLLVCRLRPEVHYPWVMVVYQQNQPVALLAGRVETIPFAPAIGYLKGPGLPVKTLTILYHGFLGVQDETVTGFLIRETLYWLSSSDVGQIIFPALDISSPLYASLIHDTSVWFCEKGLHRQLHWQGRLPDSTTPLLQRMKSSHRGTFLKRQRNFSGVYGDRIKWQWLTVFDNIPDTCHLIEKLACKTYQRGLGAGFYNSPEYHERLSLYARRGSLRIALLWVDDTLVCFFIGMVYSDIFYLLELGYDQSFKAYSPGILLILWMMDKLREEGIYNVDWGLGDAQYKRQLGTHAWLEQSIHVFRPSFFFLVLRFLLGISLFLDKTARKILDKIHITNQIKSAWRRRLVPRSKTP